MRRRRWKRRVSMADRKLVEIAEAKSEGRRGRKGRKNIVIVGVSGHIGGGRGRGRERRRSNLDPEAAAYVSMK